MLSLKYRIRKTNDFEKVFKEGRGLKSGFLLIKTRENGGDYSRFGFLVSQKVSKKAVERNKIKRLLRETVSQNFSKIKPGKDVVVVALPGLDVEDCASAKEALLYLFKKTGILNN